jgi:ABC-2 type transport system ATP-binding protein
VTVILTTHLMEEADRCDRLAILHEGRLVAEGAPEFLKDSVGAEVIHIESENPQSLSRSIQERFGLTPKFTLGTLRLEQAEAHKLVPELMEAFPTEIAAIRVSRPTLEDVFLRATGSEFREAESGSGGES